MKPLAEYNRKRDFKKTREPSGKAGKKKSDRLIFVVQEHHASHLHYDFRLEWEGVLKSWAVPKGPSLDPAQKRLAVEVEDHPLDYATFTGTIPKGEYGGGEVFRWDMGTWKPTNDAATGLKKGRLEFSLKGKKLNGNWLLVRTGRPSSKPQWLLIKRHDEFATETGNADIVPVQAEKRGSGKAAKTSPGKTSKDSSGGKTSKVASAKKAISTVKSVKSRKVGAEAKSPSSRAFTEDEMPSPRRSAKKKTSGGMPGFISPQLAELVTRPPHGDDWVHEVKFDGYRIQAHVTGGKCKLFTRKGHDWTEKYARLARVMRKLKAEHAIVDGELVWQDDNGRSDFGALQRAMKAGKTNELIYWAFDLLYLNGEDLKSLPLIARKERLQKLIKNLDDPQVHYSDHFRESGDKMLVASCQMHLEGIISKRVDAPYIPGRREMWTKAKCTKRQEFVIGGFTEGTGSRLGFGSLLLGVYDGDELRHCGRVGTGFDSALLLDIRKKLNKIEVEESQFDVASPRGRDLHFVKPEMVAEVSFSEWTSDGSLRAPVFVGLRTDKNPREIVAEVEKPVDAVEAKTKNKVKSAAAPASTSKAKPKKAVVVKSKAGKSAKSVEVEDAEDVGDADETDRAPKKTAKQKGKSKSAGGQPVVSHPDRVLYTSEKLTKQDVANFYQAVGEWIVPHLSDRPLSLLRCTNTSTEGFFNKHFPGKPPEHVELIPVKGKPAFFTITDVPGLNALIQYGTLEIHPWNCHRPDLELPDQIVMDFDPDPTVTFETVKEGAFELREIFEQLGLESFVKLTGGKGLHVQVPFKPKHDWDTIKNFSKSISLEMVSRHPDGYTANVMKKARTGKIFIDYLRNGRGATAVTPYGLRAREVSAVAMPVSWDELKSIKAGNVFTLKKALAYLDKRKQDPWADYFKVKQSLKLLG